MEIKQESKDATKHKLGHKKRDRARRNARQQNALDSFRGKHKELQGQVYTYDTTVRAHQYNETTAAITDWVKTNLEFRMDVWQAMTTLKEADQNEWKPELSKLEDANTKDVEDKILEQQIRK